MQLLKICLTLSDPFTVARNQHRQQRGLLRNRSGFVQASSATGSDGEGNRDSLPAPALDAPAVAPPPAPGLDTQGLAIVSMIEQQLNRYFSAMSARTEAVQRGAEASQDELARHFQSQIDTLRSDLDNQPEIPTELGIAPEVRAELQAELHTNLQVELHTALRDELHNTLRDELRAALRDELRTELRSELRSELRTELRAELQSELQAELRSEQLEEREKVGVRLNQFAAQSSAVAQQLVDTASTLHQRINDTGRALEGQIDERTVALTKTITDTVETSRAAMAEKLSIVARKVDDNDQRTVDRMLAMEERVNDQTGTRFADLDANIGRVSRGVDEAIGAMSHRLAELDAAQLGLVERIEQLAIDVSKVDEEALNRLSEQMSSAIGESMLVRIEMERLGVATGEQIDKVNVRIGELATIVNDATMDVSTAVQLERLEEIERALVELDPDQFVRKSELNVATATDQAPQPAPEVPAAVAFDAPVTQVPQPIVEAPAANLSPVSAVNGTELTANGVQFLVTSMGELQVDAGESPSDSKADAPALVDAWFDQPVPAPQFAPAPEPDPDALAATLEWEEHVEAVISGETVDQVPPAEAIDPTKAHPRRRATDFGIVEERPAPHLLRRATDARVNNPEVGPKSEHRVSENGPSTPSASTDEADEVKPFLPSPPTKYTTEAYSSDSTLSSW